MAFPTSPSNNQTALVNGIVYQWNAALGAWKRNGSINSATIGQLVLSSAQISTSNVSGTLIVSGGAGITGNLYTGGIYVTGANGITFPDGTVQTTAGVAVDAYARSTANSASSNTVIIQGVDTAQNTRMSIIEGVDTTQNTNITIATNAATAAFARANATAGGLTTANSRIDVVEGVDVGQNTRISIIEGVDTTQNTNITIATNAATAAFAQANATAGGLTTANARITVAEGVDVGQNTRMDIIEGVNVGQNTRISIIEGVDATQNTNITILQGVDTTQNTNITAADTKAQAAFNKANDAYTLANTANAAAGSGGASLTSFTATVDTFTGNGSQTEFTLSVVPDSEDNTFVFLNGVYQEKGTYSIVAANVVLTGVATANDTIEVTTVAGSIMNVSSNAYSTRIYQGNGSTNTFTISVGHTANTVMVFNNGVCQVPVSDYTVSGTTLTYVLTPEPDETIQIREMPTNSLVPLTQPVMRRYTANGAQTQFTVTAGQTANSMFVYENGVCQVPVSDYTVSGVTLTFVTAPLNNVVVQIREMSF